MTLQWETIKGIHELVHLGRNDILEMETQLLLGQGLTSLVRSVSGRHSVYATTLARPPLQRNPEEACNQVRGHTGFTYMPPLASFECVVFVDTVTTKAFSSRTEKFTQVPKPLPQSQRK